VRARARLALAALLSAPATLEADADLVGPSLAEAVGAVRVTATRAPPPAGDSARAGAPPPDSLAPGSLAKDSLALDVVARRPGRFELVAGLLPAEGGAVRAEGTATVTDEGTSFDVRLAGALPEPTSLLRGAAVDTLSLAVSGARAEAGWRRLAASFALAGAHWRELTAQGLVAEVRADSAGLALDTLGLESDVLTLGGRGSLPAEAGADGRIDVTATFDLEPLREATGVDVPTIGTNALTASATGSLDSLEIVAGLHTTALAQGEVRIAGADLDVQALLAPSDSGELAGLRRTRTELRLDRILLPHAEVSSVEASLEGGPDSLRLAATALVDEGRRGELEATVDPRPDSRHVRFDRFELQLDEDRWLLAGGPAVLSYGNGVSLSSFAVTAGRQTIAVEGGVDAEGALDLTLDVDSTGVGTVADLLGLPRLDGWIGGTARLGGTTRAPLGTLDFDAGFGLQDESPVTLRLLAEADGARATAELTMQDPEGGSARVEGIVPLPGGGAQAASTGAGGAEAAPPAPGQLDLRVSAEAFQLAHLLALLDPNQVAVLGGLLDASLTVAGPPDAPTLDGPLTLSSGAASFPALGVPWEPIRLYARGAGSDLVIDSGFVAAGPGAMRVAGRIALADSMALDVGVALESFEAIRTRAFQSVVSGDLHAGGTLAAPVVEGEISVESLDVWLDELAAASGVENVQLTEDDIQTLRERFGYIVVEEELEPPTAERLTAELAVELGRDSWIRRRANPGMAVAFSGELDVHVLPGAQPEVEGTLTTIAGRGFVEQFGKRFVLREGTVTLDGAPSSAALDLAAEYRVPSRSNPDDAEATIVLGIAGTQDSLSLELSSEPPMENADIVSYIATGRPASSHLAVADASGGGGGGVGGDLAEVGAGIAAGQIASAVELAAQRSIGLDVVEIRREGVRGATLVAGKYLSPRLYLGFAQPVLQREGAGAQLGRQSSSEIEVEYQLVRDWLLNLEGSGSALRAFLRGRFAY
ncbi:MAG TPA: translocation/assembly module TamB domain-containing protein, partial [Longimicrobiales bacterium]|nr:translocation/assembly module TamB domain-containing protein [Longimicrobiales bacterium]